MTDLTQTQRQICATCGKPFRDMRTNIHLGVEDAEHKHHIFASPEEAMTISERKVSQEELDRAVAKEIDRETPTEKLTEEERELLVDEIIAATWKWLEPTHKPDEVTRLYVRTQVLPDVERILSARLAQAAWKCRAQRTADPPQDCDYPFCQCDPNAEKAIKALQECGWHTPEQVRDATSAVQAHAARDREAAIGAAIEQAAELADAAHHPTIAIGAGIRALATPAQRDALKAHDAELVKPLVELAARWRTMKDTAYTFLRCADELHAILARYAAHTDEGEGGGGAAALLMDKEQPR